jgi:hypothetical protein
VLTAETGQLEFTLGRVHGLRVYPGVANRRHHGPSADSWQRSAVSMLGASTIRKLGQTLKQSKPLSAREVYFIGFKTYSCELILDFF